MIKIGVVSVTTSALIPIDKYLKENCPQFSLVHYLDAGLQLKVRAEGGLNESSIERMVRLLETVHSDKVDAILLTCTVFSPLLGRLQSLFPETPIVAADKAMIIEAVNKGRDIALIHTFESSWDSSMELLTQENSRQGKTVGMKSFFAKGAFEAMSKGDRNLHDKLVNEQIEKAEDEGFSTIVLSQMSIAHLARESRNKGAVIISSPESAARTLVESLSIEK